MALRLFRYRLVDQRVPAMWRSLAAARLRVELPSGKAPTTRVRLRISRMMRLSGFLVLMRRQCSSGATSGEYNKPATTDLLFLTCRDSPPQMRTQKNHKRERAARQSGLTTAI